MVRWFSPVELSVTSAEVIVASIVSRFVDPRTNLHDLEPPEIELLGQGKDEFWFDYVADLGDGWNSTFAVARTLAAEELELLDPAREPRKTRRGDMLVLGGDLVYPTPRRQSYERRLLAPYREALPEANGDLSVFAIPGNHDWYDGLREFTRLFCHPGAPFAGWKTRQRRSYFALQLPHRWWLLGVDVQLGRGLDWPQEEFFRKVGKEIQASDHVILCLPNPEWLESHHRQGGEDGDAASTLQEILGCKIEVCVAGHRHHYQRHVTIPRKDESTCPQHKITAGGGGAYLSPTHVTVHRSLRNRLERKASFPPESDSRRYRLRLLLLPILEWSFGLIPGVLYAAGCSVLFTADPSGTFFDFLKEAAPHVLGFSGLLVFVLLVLSVSMFHQKSDRFSMFLALLHASAHAIAVLYVAQWALQYRGEGLIGTAAPLLIAFGFGWIVGSAIVGVYLFVSSFFDRFADVAYAALRIEDWKSFLRFHIDENGKLTIYPIGLRRVPTAWSRRVDPDGESELDPEDPRRTEPELIETPIEI